MEMTLYSEFKPVTFKGDALNAATCKLAEQAALYRSASANYAAADKRVGYDTALILAEVEATKAYKTDCETMTDYYKAVGLDKHRANSLLTAGRIYRAANAENAAPEIKKLANMSYDNLNTISSMLKDENERKLVYDNADVLVGMTQSQVREWKSQNHTDKPKTYKDSRWEYRVYGNEKGTFAESYEATAPDHINRIMTRYGNVKAVETLAKDEAGNPRFLAYKEDSVVLLTAVNITPKTTPKTTPAKVLTDDQAAAALGVDIETFRTIKAQAIAAQAAAKEAVEESNRASKRMRAPRK